MLAEIRALLDAGAPRVGRTRFIAIDGRGGSGKSTLAATLSSAFAAEIIHTDDFASWDNPLDWHHELVDRVFAPIGGGATTLSYLPSKWWPDHHPAPVERQPVTGVMIIEGVGALRTELRPYATLGIFVELSRELSIQRGIERDRGTGQSPAALATLWNAWADREERYFTRDDPKAHADIIIDGTKPLDAQFRR